jgi:hypothetical protein
MKLDFVLWGTSVVPKEISRRTGIKPDTELARGERNAALDLPRQNLWSLVSHVESDEVSDHWANIAGPLQRARDEIRAIASTGTAKFTLVLASSERIPSLQFPAAMCEFAGYVNAIIDVDHLQ